MLGDGGDFILRQIAERDAVLEAQHEMRILPVSGSAWRSAAPPH
jgi:hypothetical protein